MQLSWHFARTVTFPITIKACPSD